MKNDSPDGLQKVINETNQYLYTATERLNKIMEDRKKHLDSIGLYSQTYEEGADTICVKG